MIIEKKRVYRLFLMKMKILYIKVTQFGGKKIELSYEILKTQVYFQQNYTNLYNK